MEKIELKMHKPKQPRMTSIEETVQLARIQQTATTSALYERKHNQKALKVLTVAAYILFVSMAAITLSFYYVFIWDPSTKPIPPRSGNNCDNKVVIPESLAVRLANSTEVTADNFFKNIMRNYQTMHHKEKMVEVKELSSLPKSMLASKSSPATTSTTTTTQSSSEEHITIPASVSPNLDHGNHQDDDDAENDADYESSGVRINHWNDTTILLDEDTTSR